jgi:hypothetical protein
MKIGHLFLSIFEIKKKVLKNEKLSVFSISLNLFGEMESGVWCGGIFIDKKTDDLSKDPPKSRISYFFTRIAFSGDLLIIFLKKYPTFTTNL